MRKTEIRLQITDGTDEIHGKRFEDLRNTPEYPRKFVFVSENSTHEESDPDREKTAVQLPQTKETGAPLGFYGFGDDVHVRERRNAHSGGG